MSKEYHGHKRFYEILEELKELHDKKNMQYANSSNPLGNFYRTGKLCEKLFKEGIDNKPLVMALAYMAKQIDGVYDIVGESKKNTVDSLKDKLMDVAVYSIICMILIEEYSNHKV
jgi:hypothetical protein